VPQVIRAAAERRPVLGGGERFPAGLVPDLVVTGVLQVLATGKLDDIDMSGDLSVVQRLLSLTDNPDPDFAIVTP